MCRTPSQSYKGHLSRGECSHIWLELGNRHENDGLICVLLERKTEEDNAPAENRKRLAKVVRQVFKSTQGNRNDTTHGKEQVITALKY